MPGIDGGSNTSRDYAPHMWILRPEGDPSDDEAWAFVGGDCLDAVPYDDKEYHIGATALGEVLCEVQTKYPWRYLGPLAVEELPEPLLYDALQKAVTEHAASLNGPALINGLLALLPEYAGVELDFPEAFNQGILFDKRISTQEFERLWGDWEKAKKEATTEILRVLGLPKTPGAEPSSTDD